MLGKAVNKLSDGIAFAQSPGEQRGRGSPYMTAKT